MNHKFDKPILRDLFWFLVLPNNFKIWLKKEKVQNVC